MNNNTNEKQMSRNWSQWKNCDKSSEWNEIYFEKSQKNPKKQQQTDLAHKKNKIHINIG